MQAELCQPAAARVKRFGRSLTDRGPQASIAGTVNTVRLGLGDRLEPTTMGILKTDNKIKRRLDITQLSSLQSQAIDSRLLIDTWKPHLLCIRIGFSNIPDDEG